VGDKQYTKSLRRKTAFNLKEQVAMVHPGEKKNATRKAELLIDAEIERVKTAEPLQVVPVPPVRRWPSLGLPRPVF